MAARSDSLRSGYPGYGDRVVSLLTYIVLALSVVGLLWSLLMVALRRPVGTEGIIDRGVLAVAAILEVALLVQLVVGIVALVGTDRPVSGITFVGYLIGCLVILPIGAFWSLIERSRWGPGILGVAFLVIPVLILRLGTIWNVGG